ncbi:MAG: hydrogenase maturation protease [Solirubrobacteraceae bacterium]
MSATRGPVLVIGVGNRLRGDDGAGPEVAGRLHGLEQAGQIRVRAHEGEGLGLLELWEGASAVVLVDTVRSGAPPGTIHRLDVTTEPVPTGSQHSTSHAIGPAEAIELGRALGALPARVVVYGVEGTRFTTGAGLSDAVERSIDSLAAAAGREARALAGG